MLKKLLPVFILLAPALTLAGELTQNSELVKMCGACHGIDGNTIVPIAPNLAGQVPGYLDYELHAYKTHNRMDEFMGVFIDPLSESDMKELVEYYKKQKFAYTPPSEAPDPAMVAKGAVLYRKEIAVVGLSCADCHGEHAEGVENKTLLKDFPRLAGQPYDYLQSNLGQYTKRMKHFSMLGMKAVAASLSAEEVKELAAYLSTLQE